MAGEPKKKEKRFAWQNADNYDLQYGVSSCKYYKSENARVVEDCQHLYGRFDSQLHELRPLLL